MKLFSAFNKKTTENKPIIIVSGLPRSGTSMMMKMVVEGGLQVVTDGIRRADDDNPNGYFELEAVKEMPKGNFAWLKGAGGKVVKVISSLLEYLPPENSYKIIFMERELSEILASQQKMLNHRNEANPVEDAEMRQQFQNHLAAIKAWLVRQPNMEVLYVNFNALMADPVPYCELVAGFIGLPMDRERMLSIPNEKLYRNRAVTENR
ncbi:MAG: sulfotransferase family protein [Anaerolineales bacterium]|nr:MAG: sulfotransferase family protein [Anaerolineales bacterium]